MCNLSIKTRKFPVSFSVIVSDNDIDCNTLVKLLAKSLNTKRP